MAKTAALDRYVLVNGIMSNPYSAYRESQVESASPLQLIHLAYESAIKAVEDAQALAGPLQRQARRASITKAQLIIGELRRMLDFNQGGDIAVQLARLYDYMQAELRKAVFVVTGDSLEQVKKLLTTLDEGWSQISAQSNGSTAQPASHSGSLSHAWTEEPAKSYSHGWGEKIELAAIPTGYSYSF